VFGTPFHFCLDRELWSGASPLKLRAIEAYETQIGLRDRFGRPLPTAYRGWLDAEGFLLSFVRRSELLYPEDIVAPARRHTAGGEAGAASPRDDG
jgi:hypothetical protein